jgi:hypothetical protein
MEDKDIRQAIELCDIDNFTSEEISEYYKHQEIVQIKRRS